MNEQVYSKKKHPRVTLGDELGASHNFFFNLSCIALDYFCLACEVFKINKCKNRCIGFEGNCCQSFFFF